MLRVAFFITLLGASSLATSKEAEQYQAKLAKLKALIEQVQVQLEEVKSNKDALTRDLADSESEIGDLTSKIKRLEQELGREKKQLALLNEQREKLQLKKRQQSRAVEAQMVSAYKLGNQSHIKALLNLEDREQVARVLRYHRYIVAARQEKITEFLATVSELNQIEPEISARSQRLSQQRQSLKLRQSDLISANKSREQTLAKLSAQGLSAQQQLDQLLQERRQLQRLLEQVTEALANIPIPSDQLPIQALKGELRPPISGGKLRHRFGSARAGGKLTWDGWLYSAPTGTPINAIHGGRVVYSDWLRGQGLLLIIDHGGGFLSLYGQNQSLFKDVGDWVKAGEVIGQAGTSGGQTEAGLYFELRHNSKPLNPKSWVRG